MHSSNIGTKTNIQDRIWRKIKELPIFNRISERVSILCKLSPADGGPIALVKDGDKIVIDLKNRRIDILVPMDELERRRREWRGKRRETVGYLKRYASMVHSSSEGAIL